MGHNYTARKNDTAMFHELLAEATALRKKGVRPAFADAYSHHTHVLKLYVIPPPLPPLPPSPPLPDPAWPQGGRPVVDDTGQWQCERHA